MLRLIVRLVADALLVALALFVAAGTVQWWRAWLLLAALFAIRFVGSVMVFQVNPDLMRERAEAPIHQDQPTADKFLVLAVLTTGFIGIPFIAGLDRFRWHTLATPTPALAAFGLLLFGSGWAIKAIALHANAFAVSVVRVQHERKQVVVDSGIYGVIRHPFYAADPLIFIGAGLWLESYVAALCAIVPIGLLLRRLHLEEEMLRRELSGYAEYMGQVPYRLIPGVW